MKNNEILKSVCVLAACAGVLAIGTISVFGSIKPLEIGLPRSNYPTNQVVKIDEGPVLAPTITVGPFDLHRRYRSMEGPYADADIRMGDLISAKQALLPEGTIKFTEHSGNTPTMKGGAQIAHAVSTLRDTSHEGRKLYWLKGFKLEVLDEAGKVEPTSEFLCHLNVDVDPYKRNDIFPEGARCARSRLLTLSQGQSQITFPEGFAVPVASDEVWHFMFQAANRTTDAHRRIKHRLTIYLIADDELVQPLTALAYFNPSVEVIVDKNKPEIAMQEKSLCALCNPAGRGVVPTNAVSSSVSSDRFGRKKTVHWLVPTGEHTWSSTLYDSEAGGNTPLVVHAVWSHIHPCCTSFSFVQVTNRERKPLWTVRSETDTSHGLQIKAIDLISSPQGIEVPAHSTYQTDITYNNTTGQPLDAMATMGAFFEDSTFARPKWVFQKDQGQFCGMNSQLSNAQPTKKLAVQQSVSQKPGDSGLRTHPVFDVNKDGPLLKQAKTIKVQTSSGNLNFIIEPKWAPKTATQMARLFEKHAFDGTEICAYQPGYLFQVALAEDKAAHYPPLGQAIEKSIRRIPLEVDAQFSKEVYHKAGMLSMARQADDPLDNTSSFSILLGDAPHLDTKYTIFGKLADDQETKDTLKKLITDWPNHPRIINTLTM